MMNGAVTADDEALLTVTVMNSSESQPITVEAVVDTGFTGHLTLPPETVERLALPIIGSAESVLADGRTVIEDVCLARVVWHGTPQPVRVLVAAATPLLGMSLLRGSELRIEARPGGAVVIRPML